MQRWHGGNAQHRVADALASDIERVIAQAESRDSVLTDCDDKESAHTEHGEWGRGRGWRWWWKEEERRRDREACCVTLYTTRDGSRASERLRLAASKGT